MTTTSSLPPIRNFHQVTDRLFRGGQPTHEGFRALKQLGIKTVVSLRTGTHAVNAEQRELEKLGLTFVHMPIYYVELPGEEAIVRFLDLVDDQTNGKIFVHCMHGKDRTGFLIAMYRMLRMGWSVQESYKEMLALGFHRFRLPHFKWTLWKYAKGGKAG